MKQIISIAGSLFISIIINAQIAFNTVVPLAPVVAGSSFQVQYIIEGAETVENFKHPVFENFRLVTGPNIYTGTTTSLNKLIKVRNIIFTLEATMPGKFSIPGTTVLLNGKLYKSKDAFIKIISTQEAARIFKLERDKSISNYFLRPGEDPYKKIKENLFVKVQVDKKSCFAGEPVLATFKLYSCLESKSDIIKNPGFYGFSVYDMINLSDKEVEAEKVNGKIFDVHTIRKVLLFPLRAGTFTIDPMEVSNKVEFSRSAVAKKTEQEIAEGIFGKDKEPEKTNAVYFESAISTEPVTVNVKPLPVNSKPANFTGATGKFSITTTLLKTELAKNEEGIFEVTINGTGNFIQLTAPVVSWPDGIEGFEPGIKDNFIKKVSPLTGSRTFRFPFVGTKKGENKIPSVQFSYFEIDSNRYKSISTSPVLFTVSEEQKINPVVGKNKKSISVINKNSSQIAAIIVIALVLIVLVYWVTRKKEIIPATDTIAILRPGADEILKTAIVSINSSDNEFYYNLYNSLWGYLAVNFNLEGSKMNKVQMIQTAQEKKIPDEITKKLAAILTACETGQFTSALPVEDRNTLLQSAKEVITSLEKYLF